MRKLQVSVVIALTLMMVVTGFSIQKVHAVSNISFIGASSGSTGGNVVKSFTLSTGIMVRPGDVVVVGFMGDGPEQSSTPVAVSSLTDNNNGVYTYVASDTMFNVPICQFSCNFDSELWVGKIGSGRHTSTLNVKVRLNMQAVILVSASVYRGVAGPGNSAHGLSVRVTRKQ